MSAASQKRLKTSVLHSTLAFAAVPEDFLLSWLDACQKKGQKGCHKEEKKDVIVNCFLWVKHNARKKDFSVFSLITAFFSIRSLIIFLSVY